MPSVDDELVRAELSALLAGIDDDALSYFTGMVTEVGLDEEALGETLSPFIESYGLAESIEAAGKVCEELCRRLRAKGLKEEPTSTSSELLEKPLVLSEMHKSQMDRETIDTLWGFDSIRQKRNDTIETTEAGSARYERKAAKEQKKFLDALESRFEGEEEDACQISNMMLPDLSGTSRELDIHVSNFTITYGGQVLLEGADLRLVRGRRYGLIGRNGVGKTTLLKHMANFDIEGFPRHHRVLHVKQEVKSSAQSVLEVVLDADVERKELLKREAEILALQNADGPAASAAVGDEAAAQRLSDELQAVYQRMEAIGCATAEARAASILSGLRFTDAMQHCPTDSLSGGWRMRVALAGALFIEPDLLMLDEVSDPLAPISSIFITYPFFHPCLSPSAHEPPRPRGRAVARRLPADVPAYSAARVPRPRVPQRRLHRYDFVQRPKAGLLPRQLRCLRVDEEGNAAGTAEAARGADGEDQPHAGVCGQV